MNLGSMFMGGIKKLGQSYKQKLTGPSSSGGPTLGSSIYKIAQKYSARTGKNGNGAAKGSSAEYNEPYYQRTE